MDLWEARAARNEALFREVNEAVETISEHSDASELQVICECSDANCTERIPVRATVYEQVRANPRHFIVATGHEGNFEHIVERHERYSIVEKEGRAGDVAEQTDPRS